MNTAAPRRYDIVNDEMVPVTQEDWDSAMRHIRRLYDELRANGWRPPSQMLGPHG